MVIEGEILKNAFSRESISFLGFMVFPAGLIPIAFRLFRNRIFLNCSNTVTWEDKAFSARLAQWLESWRYCPATAFNLGYPGNLHFHEKIRVHAPRAYPSVPSILIAV